MAKLKLVTILGTRPEIIRLAEIIKLADSAFEHVLVHTGQNYDYNLNEVFFNDLGIRKPNYFLGVAGNHLGETIGNVISFSYEILSKEKPDALLVLGDTNSVLCTIAAKRLKIPIFHMEAGNRCFDQNVPEETNRKISDHISDINLTYTEHSRRYLLSEGFRKDHVFVTGSPLFEVLQKYTNQIGGSEILQKLSLKEKNYFVVSTHREENVDIEHNFEQMVNGINSVAESYQKEIIFSTHPRTKKQIERRGIKFHPLVKSLPPFGFFDYIKLQQNAYCVLSDSGTISEESAMMSFPAISIRTSTERPEAVDSGSIILGGITPEEMLNAIDICLKTYEPNTLTLPNEYKIGDVSRRVVRVIQGYTRIIDRETWKK